MAGCNLFTPTGEPASDLGAPDIGATDDGAPQVDASADAHVEPDATCTPETDDAMCARLGAECGAINGPDNCGTPRSVACGACMAGESCDGGQCACAPESDAELCDRLVANCGALEATDNCGNTRSVECGTCLAPAVCGGGGTPNVCACSDQTDMEFCVMQGAECGPLTAVDACAVMRTVDCGACTAPETCGGGAGANDCGCPPESDAVFCARVGGCGLISATDNCGNARSANCGGCPAGESCVASVCACVPEDDATFCARLNACGTLTAFDNCATQRTTDCGTCAGGEPCNANVCACTAEDDATFCARNGRECGAYTGTDNCAMARTVADCGACGAGETCSAGTCVVGFPPAGIDTWLSADQGVMLSMQGEVTSWADVLSGELWSAPSIPNRPTLVAGAHMGLGTVRFFGGQRLARSMSVLASPQFTAFFVVKRNTTDREGPILGTTGTGNGRNELTFGTTETTMRFESATSGLSFSATVVPTDVLQVIAVRADGTNFELYQDGVMTATTPHVPAAAFEFDQVGALETLRFLRGDLYEVLLWPRPLGDAERDAVLAYLQGKYSL